MNKVLFKKLILSIMFITLTSTVWADSSKNKTRYISVDTIKLKNKPNVTAKEIHTLKYGDVVLLENEKGNWSLITLKEDERVTGWINSSALSRRKLVAESKNRTVNTSEITLAGKGLDKSLSDLTGENSAQTKNFYDFIDAVDSENIPSAELFEFIDEGNLKKND